MKKPPEGGLDAGRRRSVLGGLRLDDGLHAGQLLEGIHHGAIRLAVGLGVRVANLIVVVLQGAVDGTQDGLGLNGVQFERVMAWFLSW